MQTHCIRDGNGIKPSENQVRLIVTIMEVLIDLDRSFFLAEVYENLFTQQQIQIAQDEHGFNDGLHLLRKKII